MRKERKSQEIWGKRAYGLTVQRVQEYNEDMHARLSG
jgi:hypothetical protein